MTKYYYTLHNMEERKTIFIYKLFLPSGLDFVDLKKLQLNFHTETEV